MPNVSVHDVPLALRIQAIRRFIDTCPTPDLFGEYFPTRPLGYAGIQINYEYCTMSRRRPHIVSRGAPPVYTDPDVLQIVNLQAETIRPGKRISAEEYKDWRQPGTEAQARGIWSVQRRTAELRRLYQNHINWLRSCGLQGHKQFRPPSAEDIHYDELLLCSSAALASTVSAPWNTAAATATAAATNLSNILADINAAILLMQQNCAPTDDIVLIMNQVTLGYIEVQAIMAQAASGFVQLWNQIQSTGHVGNLFGYEIDWYPQQYTHPITGTATYYIPTNAVIITSRSLAAQFREMVECEPCHVDAPPGYYGVYLSSWKQQEAPGGFRFALEWTGAPLIALDYGQYVYTDVTNT